jgi:hypothetical protein
MTTRRISYPASAAEKLARLLERASKSKSPLRDLCEKEKCEPSRDFIGASLRNWDFRDQDLRGFNFACADLRGSDFRRANVTGVCFVGADITGSIGLHELSVFFSYAKLDAIEENNIQDEFFKRLSGMLAYPPKEFNGLPRITLWRDENDLRATDRGDAQIDAACDRAFLGLLMVSHRYPYSGICRHEASFFLTNDGKNLNNKACLAIGVNIDHTEMPEEFTRNIRKIMYGKAGENLILLWSSPRPADRLELVKGVSREIFLAAQRFISSRPNIRLGMAKSKLRPSR